MRPVCWSRPGFVLVWCLIVPFIDEPTTAAAEEETSVAQVLETEEVVVSATKTEIPVKQVTSAVEVITGEQLQQRKVRTVAEALRLRSGAGGISKRWPWHTRRRSDARWNSGTDSRLDRWCDRQ